MLTDPSLESIMYKDAEIIHRIKNAFINSYAIFTRKRIEYLELIKNDENFKFVFDEDL